MLKLLLAPVALLLGVAVAAGRVQADAAPAYRIETKVIQGPSEFDGLYLDMEPTSPESSYIVLVKSSGSEFGYDEKHKTITIFEAPPHGFPESLALNGPPEPNSTHKPQGYHNMLFGLGYGTSGFSKTVKHQTIKFENADFPRFKAFCACNDKTTVKELGSHKGPTLFWRNAGTKADKACADVDLVHV